MVATSLCSGKYDKAQWFCDSHYTPQTWGLQHNCVGYYNHLGAGIFNHLKVMST